MTGEATTTRLLLHPLELADAEQVQVLFPHWEIVRYLLNSVPWPYPADGAFRYFRDVALPSNRRGDSWDWTIRLRRDPEQIIGAIGLVKGEQDNRGFWMGLPWQGQGLMREACAWANEYWFETLGFPTLRVAKATANSASRRISVDEGMRLVYRTERDFVGGRLPAEVWEIGAEEWRAWKARRPGP